MGFLSPQEIVAGLGDKAVDKSNCSVFKVFWLSILGGVFISLGYLCYIRVVGTLPPEWGSFGGFLGASVFPIGLISIVLLGGELATGNMMTMFLGYLQKKVSMQQVLLNWLIVILGNTCGGVLTAFLFGHFVGLTENAFLAKTIAVAMAKVGDSPGVALVSGIGCNIFVCMAVWIATGAKEYPGKFLGLWFPIMAFVAIGFQHVVANTFIIPAAIFSGESMITWVDFLENLIFVFIGNVIVVSICLSFLFLCHL